MVFKTGMSEMIDGKSILDQLLGAATGARGGQGQGGLGDLSRMSGSLGSGGGQPASGSGAGGLGDMLGNILGGAGGGAGGSAGGAGGLGDLLGGMLGGNGGGSAASAGKSGGGGIGDVVGKVTEYAKQNPGISMAGAGGLAAGMFSSSWRRTSTRWWSLIHSLRRECRNRAAADQRDAGRSSSSAEASFFAFQPVFDAGDRLADVGEGIEGALRRDAGNVRDRVQPLDDDFPATVEGRIILSTSSCGPSMAAMPANWLGALTQDQQLTASLRTLS
jgi:hypothetical protein